MKNMLFILLIIMLPVLNNCDCICVDRDLGQIKIKLTINDENPTADVVVFRGKWEYGDTLFVDNVREQRIKYDDLEPDQYYSAVVVYQQGSREITVVDGRYLDFKENDDCDCYRAETIHLNLKLAD